MDLKSLTLLNNKKQSSKSLAYKLKSPIFEINSSLIDLLINVSKNNLEKNVRFCLHENSESLIQKMLIYERKKMNYPPHIHKNRDESHVVLKGDLELFILDKNGAVLKRIVNSSKDKNISTVPANFGHLTRPISDFVIYLEIKNGPHTEFKKDCFNPNPYNTEIMNVNEYNKYLDGFQ